MARPRVPIRTSRPSTAFPTAHRSGRQSGHEAAFRAQRGPTSSGRGPTGAGGLTSRAGQDYGAVQLWRRGARRITPMHKKLAYDDTFMHDEEVVMAICRLQPGAGVVKVLGTPSPRPARPRAKPWSPRAAPRDRWARAGVPSLTMGTDAASGRGFGVRLAADPASVPNARHFVVDACRAIGRSALADVAELVVSELAANAALHSRGEFMRITVAPKGAGVRVSVEDDGPVGIEAVTPSAFDVQDQLIDVEAWDDQPTTGRGLAIVSMLAAEWGADPTGRGNRVWADLIDPDAVQEVRPPVRASGSEQEQSRHQIF